jgi:hypothetical protein
VSRPPVIAVRTEVVLRHLVDGLFDAAAARVDDELPPPVESALARALEAVGRATGTEAARATATRLARAGHAARTVECERFEPARQPLPWLAARLRARSGAAHGDWADAAVAVAGELARRASARTTAAVAGALRSGRICTPGGLAGSRLR